MLKVRILILLKVMTIINREFKVRMSMNLFVDPSVHFSSLDIANKYPIMANKNSSLTASRMLFPGSSNGRIRIYSFTNSTYEEKNVSDLYKHKGVVDVLPVHRC